VGAIGGGRRIAAFGSRSGSAYHVNPGKDLLTTLSDGAVLADDVIAFGSFRLHPARRSLLDAGRPVRLGSRAFDILVVLVEQAAGVIGKEELIARVWPDTTVEEANLRVHIAALRKVLGDNQASARFIANVPGRGYSFVAQVTRTAVGTPETAQLAAQKHMLPAPITRAIGRDAEIGALADELRRRRLVTLVGPGGIGKTTVALAAAGAVAPSFRDGAALLDLADVGEPGMLPAALASLFGAAGRGEDATASLRAYLRDKAILLLLDGCEHVVEAAAASAETLLRAAPGLTILATSTEPLRAQGEWVSRLPPMGVPPANDGLLTAADALRAPAVQLFVERAAAAVGGFELRDADAPAVAEMCRRLDGIPLAIELAAGRMDAFAPTEMSALLDDRFRLLARGRRTALPRHETLRAMFEWSCGLLSEVERLVLRRLSIFVNGFALSHASAVVAFGAVPASELPGLLASLVAKSLVVAEGGQFHAEYRLLDTTRAFLREQLEESGELEQAARRHAEFFRALFERAEAEWERRPTAEWVAAYAGRMANLRAALDWSLSSAGDIATGVALAAAAVPLWCQLSLVDEGLRQVERALACMQRLPGADPRQATRLHAAFGWLQMYAAGKVQRSAEAWRRALELAETSGDLDYQMRALWAAWADRQNHGAFRESWALAQQFLVLAERSSDPADAFVGGRMSGTALHFLGDQTAARAQLEHVLQRYVRPLARSDAVRFQFDQRLTARMTLARILWLQGFADQALRAVEADVAHAESLGHVMTLSNYLAQAACPVALLAGELNSAARFTALLHRHTRENALDVWRTYADCFQGERLVRQGDVQSGLRLLQAAIDVLRQASFTQYLTSLLCALARGFIAAGGADDALATVQEGLDRCERTGERWCLPELLRIRGEAVRLRAAADDAAEAEAAFRRAMLMARAQGALAWELRAATSLARHWQGGGRAHEARTTLSQVVARFAEGFDTADLKDAAELLGSLSGPYAG
jgi:predicted ATPase/DNA-binding winged helix-turn-helix (wHTH) protein